ncbi:MAG: hypothetical protein WBQ10_14375 [Terriglobales bacterium]
MNVLTWHDDIFRTGDNLNETILTPANVNPTQFGKIFSYPVDGMIYAQPLYVQNVTIPGQGTHNVVYVATENDSVFAFDADSAKSNPNPLWHVNFTNPPNVTAVPCTDNFRNCNVYPIIGITGTPVINLHNNSLYVVARTKEINGSQVGYFVRLHVLDITTGAEKPNSPVVICGKVSGQVCSFPPYGPTQSTFDPQREMQRPALLLMPNRATAHEILYIAFGNHRGWVLAYDSETRELLAAYCTGPDLKVGDKGSDGIWGTGGGTAGDAQGNMYATTADGPFDAILGGADYGDTLLKLSLTPVTTNAGGTFSFTVTDYFTPGNYLCLQEHDLDLSSGSPVILPKQPGPHANEILVAGKSNPICNANGGSINVVDRDNMGHVNGQTQAVNGSMGGYFASGAYWQGANATYVYYAGADPTALEADGTVLGDSLRLYTLQNGVFNPTTSVSQSPESFLNGATPAISANGTQNGIIWLVERRDRLVTKPGSLPAFLHAYDATNVATELYNSEMNATRDTAGHAAKFVLPTITNGKVYFGTQTELDVYGLCPCPQ